MRPCQVYILTDANDLTVYVGITWSWLGRRDGHMRKWWWPQVATVTLIDVPDKRTALAMEATLIESRLPLYNAQHRTLPLPWTGDGPAPRYIAPRLGNPRYAR